MNDGVHAFTPPEKVAGSLREQRQSAERQAITHALRQFDGQVPAAAAALCISRAQLYRLISQLQVDHHSFEPGNAAAPGIPAVPETAVLP